MISLSEIQHGKVLIVDEHDVDALLLERMLRDAGYVSVTPTTDPDEACELHIKNHYDLILLDFKMPGLGGLRVMESLKGIETDAFLPVLVIVTQADHKLRALKAGGRDFVTKPFDLAEVLARVHNMLEVRLLHKRLKNYNDALEQRVRERASDLQESYLETIFAMTRAAEHKDEDTGAHVQRISYYSRELAGRLGLDGEFIDKIFFASPMHDIGKIGIPDHILRKTVGFTPDEWAVMKGHTLMGAKILGNGKSPYLKMGAEIALDHHERWDGGGYPNGKQEEAISLAARIMSICDVYDALRSKRPYKPAFDHPKAVGIIMRGDGRTQPEHFDPAIIAAFLRHHESFRDIFEATKN